MTEFIGETKTIKLPNGIHLDGEVIDTITVREFGGDEERMLGSKNPNSDLILCRCITQVGHITDTGTIYREIFPNMRIGDYNKAMFEIRRLTLGDEFLYESECPSCKAHNKRELVLAEIETVWAEDSGAREWTYTLKSGSTATFGPIYTRHQGILEEIQKSETDVLRRSLAVRLLRVDGEDVEGETNMKRVKAGIKMLMKAGYTMGDGERIRMWLKEESITTDEDGDEVRKAKDGNIDTVIWDECPKCNSSWRHRLALGFSFLFPSASV